MPSCSLSCQLFANQPLRLLQVVVLAMGTNDFLQKDGGASDKRAPPFGLPNLKAWQDGYLAVVQEVRGHGFAQQLASWASGCKLGACSTAGSVQAGPAELCPGHGRPADPRCLSCSAAPQCLTCPPHLSHTLLPIPPSQPQLRRAYPSAAIVNLVWPREQLDAGVLSQDQAQRYQQWMAAAFERLRAAGMPNVHMLQVGRAGQGRLGGLGASSDAATAVTWRA